MGRLKERIKILRRLLRPKPWPLALAILLLGVLPPAAGWGATGQPGAAPPPYDLTERLTDK